MSRREQYQVYDKPPQSLFLASAEDVIIHKLNWYKLGENVYERQWNDVLGVLQVQHKTLDYVYMKRVALHYEVNQLLEQAMGDAEIGNMGK